MAPFFVFETFRQPISANVRERQPRPLMQLLYRTRYRSHLLPNHILSALCSNISMGIDRASAPTREQRRDVIARALGHFV